MENCRHRKQHSLNRMILARTMTVLETRQKNGEDAITHERE
jgi:hypothetical protein